jgi:MFS family permease
VQRGLGALGIAGFVLAALLIGWISGRFGQRVFDDEAVSLAAIETRSYGALISFYLGGGDVHPPLPFLWLRLWHDLQAPVWLQRALSLSLASAGFALILDLLWRRQADRPVRIAAAMLFLAAPLLYGMGASLRWYPLLVLPVALAIWRAERAGRPTLLTAIGFGLAANISFFAAIPALAYVLWRYAIARRFEARADYWFLAATGIIAMPGLIAFFASSGALPAQTGDNVLTAFGTTVLGVLGGYGLGLTHSLIAIPSALVLFVGTVAASLVVWRRPVDGLLAISLLVLLLCVAVVATGFAKPRSFLFAVPFLLASVVLAVGRFRWQRWYLPGTAAACFGVAMAALWLLDASDRPFKRNLHIPDDQILAVVRQHAPKETSLIVSSEPSLGWRLQQDGYCVIAASLPTRCGRQTAQTVLTIDDGTFTQRESLYGMFSGLGEHRLVHQQVFGDDEDGPTKTFLTGRLVPKWLISLAIYKRD